MCQDKHLRQSWYLRRQYKHPRPSKRSSRKQSDMACFVWIFSQGYSGMELLDFLLEQPHRNRMASDGDHGNPVWSIAEQSVSDVLFALCDTSSSEKWHEEASYWVHTCDLLFVSEIIDVTPYKTLPANTERNTHTTQAASDPDASVNLKHCVSLLMCYMLQENLFLTKTFLIVSQ